MDSVPTTNNRKIWQVGTLTYTTGGLILLCFWLLWGDFPWAMKDRAIGPSATLLIKQLGVSDFLYGLIIIAFPNFTNIFLMPMISYISDRHRGRLGRRIPFLLFTTPFIVLGIYLIGITHPLGRFLHSVIPSISEHLAMLTAFCIGWVMLDFGTTLSCSLFGALVNDVMPREILGRFFALVRMVSLAAGMLFNGFLIDKIETHSGIILFGVGTLYGIGLLSLCFMVKEGKYPPPVDATPSTGEAPHPQSAIRKVATSTVTYLRQSFSLSYYRWFMITTAIASLTFFPVNSFSIQYAKSLNLNMDKYGLYLVYTYCVSLILSFSLGSLSDRFHPLRTGMTSLATYAIIMFAGYALMADPKYFGVVFILHGIVSGCYFTLVASISPRLLPPGLFAQFSSAAAIVLSVGSMLMGPIIGRTLDCLQDYRYVFLMGGIIATISTVMYYKLYLNFQACGGDQNYQAPMPK